MSTLQGFLSTSLSILDLLGPVSADDIPKWDARDLSLGPPAEPSCAWREHIAAITGLPTPQLSQLFVCLQQMSHRLHHDCEKLYREALTKCCSVQGLSAMSNEEFSSAVRSAFERQYHLGFKRMCDLALQWASRRMEPVPRSGSNTENWQTVLTDAYERSQDGQLSVADLGVLSHATGLSAKQVRTWFSNRRARNKSKARRLAQEAQGIRPFAPLPKSRVIKGLPSRATSPVSSLSRSVSSTSSSSDSSDGSIDISSVLACGDGFVPNFQAPAFPAQPLGFDQGFIGMDNKAAWDMPEMPDMDEIMALLDEQMSQVQAEAGQLSFDVPPAYMLGNEGLQQAFDASSFGFESFMTPPRTMPSLLTQSSPAASQVSQDLFASPSSFLSSASPFLSPAAASPHAAREPSLEPSTIEWMSNVLPFDITEPSASLPSLFDYHAPVAPIPADPFASTTSTSTIAAAASWDLLALLESSTPPQPAGQDERTSQLQASPTFNFLGADMPGQQATLAVPLTEPLEGMDVFGMGMEVDGNASSGAEAGAGAEANKSAEDGMDGMAGFMDWQ